MGIGNVGYKVISFSEWESSYKDDHPNPRVSPDKSEVVLSNEGLLTKNEIVEHISSNWSYHDDGSL